jgi:hypothetical protein
MPQLAQPRTRRAYTSLTPEEHRELMHVCKLTRKTAGELLHAGLLLVMRRHLRQRGAEPRRLAAIAVRGIARKQRRTTATSTCHLIKPLPIPPTQR